MHKNFVAKKIAQKNTRRKLPVFERRGKKVLYKGKSYFPASTAALKYDYTLGHLSWLANEGRVNVVRVGKRWYFNLDSLAEHRKTAYSDRVDSGPQNKKQKIFVPKASPKSFSSLENSSFYSSFFNKKYTSATANLFKTVLGLTLLGGLLFFLASTVSISRPDPVVSQSKGSSALISFSLPSYIKNIPSVLKQIAGNLFADKDQALRELIQKVSNLENRTIPLPLTRDKKRPAALPRRQAGEVALPSGSKSLVPKEASQKAESLNEKAISALGRQVISQGLRIDSLASLVSLEQRFDDLKLTISSRLSNVPTILIPPSTSVGAGITVLNPANLESQFVTVSRLLTVQGDLSAEGKTTLGDASTDTIIFKSSSLSIPNNLTVSDGNVTFSSNLTNSASSFLTNASVSSAFEIGSNKI